MSSYDNAPNEFINRVYLLNSFNSAGYYEISPTLIKNVISDISNPLSTTINLSLNTGKVPDQLKFAKIIQFINPLAKQSNK